MRKIIIFLLLAIVFVSAVFGQDGTSQRGNRIRICVIVDGSQEEGVNELVTDRLLYAITLDRKYIPIERADEFRAAINKEHVYQHSGEVSVKQICDMGKKYGADMVCACNINKVLGTNNIRVRLIRVETERIVAAYNLADKLEDYDALVRTSDNIGLNLLKNYADRNKITVGQSYQGGIVAYVNAAGNQGLIITKQDITSSRITWNEAMQKCEDLVIDGYDDWYLPSREELGKCFANRDALGLRIGTKYWSSSVYAGKNAFFVKDNNPQMNENVEKSVLFNVRAVRIFLITK